MAKLSRTMLVLALLLAGCTARTTEQEDDANVRESDNVSASTDPKLLTLQLGDLPDGFTEAGAVVEASADDLDQKHADGDVTQDMYTWVKDSGFVSLALRQFSRNDEQVFSTAVVFRTADDAHAFYAKEPAKQVVEGAPQVGDESFTEHVESGPTPVADDEQIVDSESIRTRARVGNVVIEFIYADDAGELDDDEVFLLAKRAAGRVR